MASYAEVPLHEPLVPFPPAYTRQVSYDSSKNQYWHAKGGSEKSAEWSPLSEVYSLESIQKPQDEPSTAKRQKSLLIWLRSSRVYIRILAVLVMVASFSLVLWAVISYSRAQKKPNHPLNSVPQPAPITDHPCKVFTGVAAMNLVFSLCVLWLSFASSKFKQSNDAINATFTIISAVGFASSMGACFFLNKESTYQNDLWKWSCGNHKKGIVSDVIDFNLVCKVITYGWKLGLVQASLELLTFLISIIAFIWLKYSYFIRYGMIGKVF